MALMIKTTSADNGQTIVINIENISYYTPSGSGTAVYLVHNQSVLIRETVDWLNKRVGTM